MRLRWHTTCSHSKGCLAKGIFAFPCLLRRARRLCERSQGSDPPLLTRTQKQREFAPVSKPCDLNSKIIPHSSSTLSAILVSAISRRQAGEFCAGRRAQTRKTIGLSCEKSHTLPCSRTSPTGCCQELGLRPLRNVSLRHLTLIRKKVQAKSATPAHGFSTTNAYLATPYEIR